MRKAYRDGGESTHARDFSLAYLSDAGVGYCNTARLGGSMQVSSRMSRRPVTVSPDATLRQACDLMTKNEVRHLPVMVSSDLVGIITERDILSATARSAVGLAEFERHVADYMTSSVITIPPDTRLEEVARLFRKHHISALPVLQGKRIVGIISESDLLEVVVEIGTQDAHRARFELTVPRKPEHFQRICKLIKDRGAQLLKAERHSRRDDPDQEIVLQVSSPVIERLVEAIEGAGYEIDLIVYES